MNPVQLLAIQFFATQTAGAAQALETFAVAVTGLECEVLSSEERRVLEAVATQLAGFDHVLAAVRGGFARLLQPPDHRREN